LGSLNKKAYKKTVLFTCLKLSLPIKSIDGKIIGIFSASDALPKEIDAAMTMAQFHQQLNESA
jgi:hypothetical protein